MLKAFTHARWPVLERHVVERALAEALPIAIVVPSGRVRRRVQEALAVASRTSAVAGVDVVTVYRLAASLAGPREDRVPVDDSSFYVALVQHLVQLKKDAFRLVEPTIEFRGLARALWGTISELREAGLRTVESDQFLGEEAFGDPPPAYAGEVLRLFNAVDAFLDARKIDDRAATVRRAVAEVDAGRVPPERKLLYYGFYELLGLQVELLHALARRVDVEVFACRDPKAKALAFANRFHDDHLSSGTAVALPDREASSATGDVTRALFDYEGEPPPGRPPAIWNASGAADEVWAVAKKVLDLHDREGVPFRDIGVVAADLSEYAEVLPSIFAASRIPFEASCGAPLLHRPYARAVADLVRCAREDLARDAVIALLRSPCRDLPARSRPEAWDLLARSVGVRAGLASWEDRVAAWKPSRRDEGPTVSKAQAELLLVEVRSLAEAIDALPRKGPWKRHARAFGDLLDRLLRVPEGGEAAESAVRGALTSLERRDLFADSVDRGEFLDALAEALDSAEVPLSQEGSLGVRVLDLMSARSIPFRALFVLGMNEKSFPRRPSEDPFLRDRHRAALASVLGLRIRPRTIARVEEERTLLAWTLDAARERLTIVYQRANEAGRLEVPSTFLHEVRRVTGAREGSRDWFDDGPGEGRVPRRWSEKVGSVPDNLLTPRERASREGFEGKSPRGLYQAIGWDLAAFKATRDALAATERYGRATAYDGILGKESPVVERLRRDGLSPTGLEMLAMCPFRFLVQRALDLEPLREAEEGIDRLFLGTLYHAALERYYQADVDAGDRLPPDKKRLRACVEQVFEEEAKAAPTGLPFLWELMKRRVLAHLTEFVCADDAAGADYRPAHLEEHVEGKMVVGMRIEIHGTVDRIDLRRSGKGPAFRIVDYKSGKAPDAGLDRLALKGEKLQLPLYLYLANKRFEGSGEALLAFVGEAPEKGRFKPLPEGFWKEDGAEFRKKLEELVGIVESGRFVIRPGRYCDFCPIGFACRMSHQPTRVRAKGEAE